MRAVQPVGLGGGGGGGVGAGESTTPSRPGATTRECGVGGGGGGDGRGSPKGFMNTKAASLLHGVAPRARHGVPPGGARPHQALRALSRRSGVRSGRETPGASLTSRARAHQVRMHPTPRRVWLRDVEEQGKGVEQNSEGVLNMLLTNRNRQAVSGADRETTTLSRWVSKQEPARGMQVTILAVYWTILRGEYAQGAPGSNTLIYASHKGCDKASHWQWSSATCCSPSYRAICVFFSLEAWAPSAQSEASIILFSCDSDHRHCDH